MGIHCNSRQVGPLQLRHDKLQEGLDETLQIVMQLLTRQEIRECKNLNKK